MMAVDLKTSNILFQGCFCVVLSRCRRRREDGIHIGLVIQLAHVDPGMET